VNSAKIAPYPCIHGERKDIAYNTNGTAGAQVVKLGDLAAGFFVATARAGVGTAFNAGTTNVMEVVAFNAAAVNAVGFNPGTTAATYTWLPTATFVAGTASTTTKEASVNLKLTEDVEVYLRYNPTGTTPTTGAATALVEYYPHAEAEA